MNKHLHLDPVGGVAGDMFVAAMLDALPASVDSCWKDINDAGLFDHVDIALQTVQSHGLSAKHFHVSNKQNSVKRTGHYSDLKQWLEDGALQPAVKQRAMDILHELAAAEAFVHGVPIEKVHFHEVADWDSLVDVVAASSILERNSFVSFSCSPLPLGSGLVQTEHGKLPVPAPATAHLLIGMDVWDDGEAGERVTPTGAAIVKHVFAQSDGQVTFDTRKPAGKLVATGSGSGLRKLRQRPNILRVSVLQLDTADKITFAKSDSVVEISFDIDDMTPEELSISLEFIRQSQGVIDASLLLGIGKKGRAVFHVVVLGSSESEASICDCCFYETTTLGMRVQHVERRVLKREGFEIQDALGHTRIKVADRRAKKTAKVESDDLSLISGLQARRSRARQLTEQFES
ncbi:MAG: hypothetical protein ACI9UN_004590 [Granulosicoccus sp.]